MAQRKGSREITIVGNSGTFDALFRKFSKNAEEFDFDGLSALRRLLSNEKARILHTLKTKKPNSIYQLSRLLGRDFKSVNQDIKLLERFGFVDLLYERTGKRQRLKPVLVLDNLTITIRI